MRINAQLTSNSAPTCERFSPCDLARRRKTLAHCLLWGVSWAHLQICANTAIHQSMFVPILILMRVYNLSSYICLLFRSSCFIFAQAMAFSWRGCSLPTIPPVGRRSPLLRTWGYVILRGSRDGSVGSAFGCEPMCCRFKSSRG